MRLKFFSIPVSGEWSEEEAALHVEPLLSFVRRANSKGLRRHILSDMGLCPKARTTPEAWRQLEQQSAELPVGVSQLQRAFGRVQQPGLSCVPAARRDRRSSPAGHGIVPSPFRKRGESKKGAARLVAGMDFHFERLTAPAFGSRGQTPFEDKNSGGV